MDSGRMKTFPVQGLSAVLYYLKIKGIVNKAVCQTAEKVRNNIVDRMWRKGDLSKLLVKMLSWCSDYGK